ncbi:MAG TPA: trypsin-like serine protease [Thermoanaerobaculia bacterium]
MNRKPLLKKFSATLERVKAVFKPRIENGNTVPEASFPFLVKLIYEQGPQFKVMCAGIALDEHWVLTAGHCASQVNFVRPAGTSNLFTFEPHPHPDFIGSSALDTRHDLALLRVTDGTLPQHWDISRILRAADIPGSSSFVAFGWGKPRTNERDPDLRRSNLLSFQPAATCETIYFPQKVQAGSELCVGRPSMSPCRNDSGGPLFTATGNDRNPVLGSLVGVVSKADRDCSNSGPAIFSSFDDAVLQWIRDRNNL